METVKLPADFVGRKPRQLSGGQKQRVAIARALAGDPDLVVADEPVSALDVSVQAAIINLLMELQATRDATLIFISHDLSVVRYLADRVAVMYLGKIVEFGEVDDVFQPPYHPYTESLLSAVPIPDPDLKQKRIILEGNLPSVRNIPPGCPFATRCPRRIGDDLRHDAPAGAAHGHGPSHRLPYPAGGAGPRRSGDQPGGGVGCLNCRLADTRFTYTVKYMIGRKRHL